jgi:biopolymer transport protein TolR
MARTFRRHRQSHPISELNVTNLIDLAFTLLIIFMTATPLITQEQTVPVNLPVQSKIEQPQPDKNTKFVALTLDAKGTIYLDTTPISPLDLGLRLRSYDVKNTVIRIRAEGTVPYQKIISLMEEVQKSGLSRISFDTQAGG